MIIIELNIKGGFRGAGFVPMHPQNIVFKLDVKLVTPESSRSFFCEAHGNKRLKLNHIVREHASTLKCLLG